jgi:6,7-dimethyl-8-ribityllumazine synthase
MNQRTHENEQSNSARRIAFLQACWHKEIVDQCRTSLSTEIERYGFVNDDVDYFEVPGSF